MKASNVIFYFGLAFLTIFSTQGLAAPGSLIDPLQEINIHFPDSIKLRIDGERSIEFCPDNTCDLFVAKPNVSIDTLKDFAYLYIYFLSDYYVLENWRKTKKSMLVVESIISKIDYGACNNDNLKQAAYCLLRHLSSLNKIECYAIRYDENSRSAVRIDIFSATNPLKNGP